MRITAILRQDRPDKYGLCQILLRVTIGKKRIYKPTTERVSVEAWNNGKVRAFFPNAKVINDKLEKLAADLKSELLKEELRDKTVTVEMVKSKLNSEKKNYDFYSYCEKLISSWRGKKKDSTLSKYTHELSKIKKYAPDLQFADVTREWLGDYERYQRDKLGNQSNTLWRSFKNLKTFFNAAIKEGVIKDYPFARYDNPKYQAGQRTHLTQTELVAFRDYLRTGKLANADRKAGYFFIFSCLTGLRYSDCKKFRSEEHIIEGKRIWLRTTKTAGDVSILITDKIREALDKITEGEMPTNQECNRALKAIASGAKIKKELKFHSARHTFGYSCAEANIPIEITAKLMGHANTKVTNVYYHINNANVDRWMDKLHG